MDDRPFPTITKTIDHTFCELGRTARAAGDALHGLSAVLVSPRKPGLDTAGQKRRRARKAARAARKANRQ